MSINGNVTFRRKNYMSGIYDQIRIRNALAQSKRIVVERNAMIIDNCEQVLSVRGVTEEDFGFVFDRVEKALSDLLPVSREDNPAQRTPEIISALRSGAQIIAMRIRMIVATFESPPSIDNILGPQSELIGTSRAILAQVDAEINRPAPGFGDQPVQRRLPLGEPRR
jgi:hypothetical protein